MTELDPSELLKESAIAIKKLQNKLKIIQQKREEPFAVVGMSCRFPGGANTVEAFWELLDKGVDGTSEVPPSRWDVDEYFDPDPDVPGKMITKRGGFLDIDISLFDAEFFGISPREAELMDPQQRLLLEVTYEALCNAGIDPAHLRATQTGVFIGIGSHDYVDLLIENGITDVINLFYGTGNSASVASGRISFVYDFQGPNFAIDTACSSSLVAIDQACESLREGTSNLALAGGVNLILAPNVSVAASKAGMLSPDGRCKTFDASADGYVRGEGCGMIVLKRYSDALRDGNRILALIKSTGINQDGASSGLTVPNKTAQEDLIKKVLSKGLLKPSDIDYIEVHGTGTSLGDPIEVRAIESTYGVRDSSHPLKLGSVKTNIGHLEAAAGIAGVIKTILALQHETIPPNLHFSSLNPHIKMSFPAEIVTKTQAWKRGDRIRRAAVSSFGFSGTNAHLILEEAPLHESAPPIIQNRHQFRRKRYWMEQARPGSIKTHKFVHPLLGQMQHNSNETISFYGNLNSSALPYLKDYQIYDYVLYPASGFFEMMLAAGRHGLEAGVIELKKVCLEEPLFLAPGKSAEPHVLMQFTDTGCDVSISTQTDNGGWSTHATGIVSIDSEQDLDLIDLDVLKSRFILINKDEFYKKVNSSGVHCNDAFQTLVTIYKGEKEALGELRTSASLKGYLAHPTLLEGSFQLLALSLINENTNAIYLPIACDSFKLYADLEDHLFAHWQETESTDTELSGTLKLMNSRGKLLATTEGMRYRKTTEQTFKQMLSDELSTDRWMYEWVWQEHIIEEDNLPVSIGHWLILGDGDIVKKITGFIESKGGTCRTHSLNDLPKTKEECATLIENENYTGVVHLITTAKEGDLTSDDIRTAQFFGVETFLHLKQAQVMLNGKTPLFLINTISLENSPLDGLFKTALLEYPDQQMKHILLGDHFELEMLMKALFAKEDESILAIKGSDIQVPRVIRQIEAISNRQKKEEENLSSKRDQLRPDATYLITGGLGALGQALTKFLAQKGARHIVLTGRSKVDQKLIDTLNISDAALTYVALDVSDELAVKDLVEQLTQSSYPLKGIFHLAGVLDDALLMEQDWPHFEKVFAPKVYGSFHLHHYSKDLDFFVLYSSAASVLGSPGQSNYAAANAFMDALCEYRQAKGLPAQSLSWADWSEIGLAKDVVSRHAAKGILPFNPSEGMRAFEAAFSKGSVHTLIANINRKLILKQMFFVPSWLKGFEDRKSTKAELSVQLEALEVGERLKFIANYVEKTVKEVLGIAPSRSIDQNKGFAAMGLDSMLAVELKNRLQAAIGKDAMLPTTALFDHSTIEKLSQYIAHLLKVENIQLRKRQQNLIATQLEEPIAIIGMSCRFPGGANSPEAFWDLLYRGEDAISEVPAIRFDADSYYDPDPEVPGKMITKMGGFLDFDISLFDAEFFGISPREAEFMDPQQRLLLELSYEALEAADIEPASLQGSQTGVFIGTCSHDYMNLLIESGDKALINPYIATGNAASVSTGRISFVFDFQGPNMAIDTACSSSLVAIDQACQSLRNGTSSLALAGGVNLILVPDVSINFSKAGMLAPDGRCKTFDASADGYVRGEGCGIIVLKRYSDALRDGNPILAVIKASSINQDGASSGLTVPNGEAQEALINHVLTKAKLKGSDIDYVEAHGTGTSLGDPIEVRALGSTYGRRDASQPLKLGSVKTNIGHLEGAAGIAGVIKTVLALQHETIPPHLHFQKLNPHIETNFPVEVVTRNQEWKRGGKTRRAAVSSFGFSGTNAHLIIEEGPLQASFVPKIKTHHQFQGKRYWVEASQLNARVSRDLVHPLLGEMHSSPSGAIMYFNSLGLSALPYLKEHQVYGHIIYPGAGYLEMMLAAARHGVGEGVIELSNVAIELVLNLPKAKKTDAQVLMSPTDSGYEVAIYTQGNTSSWSSHATGRVSVKTMEQERQNVDIEALKARFTSIISGEEFYSHINSTGMHYGKPFQTLNQVYVSKQEALGEVILSLSPKGYLAHPTLLDGCLQLSAAVLANENGNDLYLPVGLDSFLLLQPLEDRIYAHLHEAEINEFGIAFNLELYSPSGMMLAQLKGMRFRRATEQAVKQMLAHQIKAEEWVYEWVWQEHPPGNDELSIPAGHWLVLGADKSIEQLIGLIENSGITCRTLDSADLPKTKEEFATLIDKENPAAIVFFKNSSGNEELNTEKIRIAQQLGAKSYLYLIQGLVQLNRQIPLFLINTDSLENSPLNGLFKTAYLEHPELEIKQIGLSVDWDPQILLNALFAKNDEAILQLKEDKLYVPRLIRHTETNVQRETFSTIRSDATYLITGGRGGVGSVLVKFLIQKGAKHIVLTGRSEFKENFLEGPEFAKADISYESLDSSNEQAVEELITRLTGSAHPLKGIFHLAGVLDDATLMEQDWPHFEKVFAPKVYGSYYLHKYAKDLDFFVLFSSVSSVWGSPGQSNYAAANAFLDALCAYRKAQGLNALSISWGSWAELGMAKDLIGRHARGGLIGFNPQDGLRALESVLFKPQAHLVLANINWKVFLKQLINLPPWLKGFGEQVSSKGNLSTQLEAVDAGERLSFLKAYISTMVKEILGLPPLESLDEKKGFTDMGFDSLMTVELKNRLQDAIGKQAILAATALFDHSTIDKLSEYIAQLLKLENIQIRKRSQASISVQSDEPIAIIGMSCRFPGGGNNPEAFWAFLQRGGDGVVEVPASRWDADSYYDPDPEASGKMITKLGGFLDIDVSLFDAEFFGISPREAEFMDPQQRLLLEVTHEAIESADIEPASLEGTQTGVYIGIFNFDYVSLLRGLDDKTLANPFLSTGNLGSATAGRISYVYDFQGPCIAVDTACSSSLVAIDQACISLRNGTVSLAVAGGVNLILNPDPSIVISKAGMLSPDGHCKTFDASADGYVRGEGCGVILLKRYSEALRDGNPILALIKSSGVNQDGASSGLTVPNGEAQEALINDVLAKAKLKSADIDYIEAHGTGTSLGDPIEVRAIGSTYGVRDAVHPLKLGSVKTNIGHLEAAAGIAGVIKTVLALQHETIPPNLHFNHLNPHIELSFPAEIVTKNQEWKRGEKIRRAAVSSFGFSGTNAHLIIEEAPVDERAATNPKIPIRQEFQRKRFWIESAMPGLEKRFKSIHPLLGQMQNNPNDAISFTNELFLAAMPYLKEHQVYDFVIFPGAGYLEMMLAAARYGIGEGVVELTNVSIESALNVPAGKKIEMQVLLNPSDSGSEVEIYTKTGAGAWRVHAKGILSVNNSDQKIHSIDIESLKSRFPSEIGKEWFYTLVNLSGIKYGAAFQTLDRIYVGDKEALGELTLSLSAKGYLAHPVLLDGCFQLLATSFSTENAKEIYMPVGCDSFTLYAPLHDHIFAHWQETAKTNNGRSGNLELYGPSGELLAALKGMHYHKTTVRALKNMLESESSVEDWMYEWEWLEHIPNEIVLPDPLGHWLILGNKESAEKLSGLIESNGGSYRSVIGADLPQTQEEFVALLEKESPAGILHAIFSADQSALTSDSIRNAQDFGVKSFLHLTQALLQLNRQIPVFLINEENLENSPLNGFFKSVVLEHPDLEMKHISLRMDWDPEMLLKLLFAKDDEIILALHGDTIYIPRLQKLNEAKAKRHELIRPVDQEFILQSKEKGLIENLTLDPFELKDVLAPDEVEIEVRAAGLNFRDVLITIDALGFLKNPGPIGGDGSGIVTRVGESVDKFHIGDAVFGLMAGTFATKTYTHQDNITFKPPNLTFEEAAALPTVFLTSHYAFTRSTQLKPGDTILIHAGAGGVGQAAIQLAKLAGATIIATAGDEKKREFLKAQGIKHVFDSRHVSFGDAIKKATDGLGVDVVLNSLSGEGFIEASLSVCKPGARFLEIGKRNIWTKEQMQTYRPDIDYHVIALDNTAVTQPEIVKEMLDELMPLFEQGKLNSIPITTFSIERSIQAFEYMKSAKHIGKIVIRLTPQLQLEDQINPHATYLITGGLGALGQVLTKFLAQKGARHIVLTGRSKPNREIIDSLEIPGVALRYESLDVSDEQAVKELIERLAHSPQPLKGIFHLAAVLDDALLENLDWSRFEKVFAPKVYGSFYLHHYSRDLDFFVLFSSAASVLGSPGQINYSAANAFMDALCEYRKEKGLAGLSLSWGPWSEIGLAKDLVSRHATKGMIALSPRDGIRALESALSNDSAHTTIVNINRKLILKQTLKVPSWLKSFMQNISIKAHLSEKLEAIDSMERLNFIKKYVSDNLKEVLGISMSRSIDEKKGFASMGLDSMLAIELKNKLQTGIGKETRLATTALFDHSNVEKLSEYIAQLLKVENIRVRKRTQAEVPIELNEPIAIIGMSCRFPGGANDPEAFWEFLHRGGDGVVEVPSSRWDADSFYDPDPEAPNKMITKRGGFLDSDVSLFDAEFFGISPREAEYMDPQQRILLELSYEAIESAGIEPATLQGTQTGVFIGISSNDYVTLLTGAGANHYIGTGNASSTASGRISYVFDFQGPNFAIDSACSSSLVAIDQACTSLRNGTSTMALAGGVNLMLSPAIAINFSKAGMLAPDGHCKTFDASADGFVRGEGCGIIVLKRYSDALRDGNRIHAVIKACAINQDGASSGLTVPNGEAQEALINHVLAQARLKGSDIDYIEAHGTGTALGDPIEVRAIGATYGVRDSSNPLTLGSVKTNIGHLEAAAGIAGVIKTVLALKHQTIPPNLHFKLLNPHIEMDFPAAIATKGLEWKRGKKIRRAAVSSFGFSGTNAHLILEEAPLEVAAVDNVPSRHQFRRKRYWVEGAIPVEGVREDVIHPLLGQMLTVPNGAIIFHGRLQLDRLPYLKDHEIYGFMIYPGAGFMEMMLAAARFGLDTERIELKEISIESILNLTRKKKVPTQVLMNPAGSDTEVIVYTQSADDTWTSHARAKVLINKETQQINFDLELLKSRLNKVVTKEQFYSQVNSEGIFYGPAFQTLDRIYLGRNEALAELTSTLATKGYFAHPTLLDGCLQLVVASLMETKDLYLPVGCDSFKLYAPLQDHLFAHWEGTESSDTGFTGNLQLFSSDGTLLAKLVGMHYRKTTEQALKQRLGRELSLDDWMYEWTWQEHTFEDVNIPDSTGNWLIIGEGVIVQEMKGLIGESSQTFACDDLPKNKQDFAALIENAHPAGLLLIVPITSEEELTSNRIRSAQDQGPKIFLHLIQAMEQVKNKIPIILINEERLENSTLNGLFKTAWLEYPEIHMKQIILGNHWNHKNLLYALFAPNEESIFALREETIFVPRIQKQKVAKEKRQELSRPHHESYRLHSREKGLLANLTLVPLKENELLAPYEVEIDVQAAGLNFRDVLDALGLYPGDAGPLGSDGSGIVARVGASVTRYKPGDRVFGVMKGSLATKANTLQDLIAHKPQNFSFEEAAALPTVFLTAYYGLSWIAKLMPGEVVLIHAGAGGVGQAAIQLAKLRGATIIATAGDEKKRAFLKQQGVEHVFDSRQITFGKEIMDAVGGGVDVVLNSLSGEGFIETSLSVCKPNARFLEIGKRNIWTQEQMKHHRPDIDYHVIALDDIAIAQPGLIHDLFVELLPLFTVGKLTSIPFSTFPIEKSIQAFDYMKSAKHIGKVVITLTHQQRELHLSPDATYLITGGLGGIGKVLTEFLVSKGARHIFLIGRTATGQDVSFSLPEVTIDYQSLDISNEQAVKTLMARLSQSPYPLKGIFHLAGIVEDALLKDQEWSHFESVFAPKVYGSFYLHKYSEDLDFFVLFSSVSSVLGSLGQGNYAAANAFLDALCQYRQQQGFPGLTISFGSWSEVGMAKDLVSRHSKNGVLPIKPKEGVQALENAMAEPQAHCIVASLNWKTFLKQMIAVPSWLKDFGDQKSERESLLEQLKAVELNKQYNFVRKYVATMIKSLLGMRSSDVIDETKGFAELGFDSLMTLELRNRLQIDIGPTAILPSSFVFDYPTVEKLSKRMAEILRILPDEKDKQPQEPETAEDDALIEKDVENMDIQKMQDFIKDLQLEDEK